MHTRGPKNTSFKLKTSAEGTRWAPSSYEWSYNPYKWPYKWLSVLITLVIGVITQVYLVGGPPCMNSEVQQPDLRQNLGFPDSRLHMPGTIVAAEHADGMSCV